MEEKDQGAVDEANFHAPRLQRGPQSCGTSARPPEPQFPHLAQCRCLWDLKRQRHTGGASSVPLPSIPFLHLLRRDCQWPEASPAYVLVEAPGAAPSQ